MWPEFAGDGCRLSSVNGKMTTERSSGSKQFNDDGFQFSGLQRAKLGMGHLAIPRDNDRKRERHDLVAKAFGELQRPVAAHQGWVIEFQLVGELTYFIGLIDGDTDKLQTFAAKITQLAFDYLDAPPVVLGARNWNTPPDEVEDSYFPFPNDILDAIHTHIQPLEGYAAGREGDTAELLRRSKEGV